MEIEFALWNCRLGLAISFIYCLLWVIVGDVSKSDTLDANGWHLILEIPIQ